MGERKRGKTGKWNVWICSFFRPSYNGTFGTADVLNPQMILQSDKEYKPDSGGKVPCCSTKPSRGLNQTEETTFIQGFIWFFIYFLKDSPPTPAFTLMTRHFVFFSHNVKWAWRTTLPGETTRCRGLQGKHIRRLFGHLKKKKQHGLMDENKPNSSFSKLGLDLKQGLV